MNEQEFKQHLKDLVHGHHHLEEHDWDGKAAKKKAAGATAARRRPARKTGKK